MLNVKAEIVESTLCRTRVPKTTAEERKKERNVLKLSPGVNSSLVTKEQ